jgi:hypothetical protein
MQRLELCQFVAAQVLCELKAKRLDLVQSGFEQPVQNFLGGTQCIIQHANA